MTCLSLAAHRKGCGRVFFQLCMRPEFRGVSHCSRCLPSSAHARVTASKRPDCVRGAIPFEWRVSQYRSPRGLRHEDRRRRSAARFRVGVQPSGIFGVDGWFGVEARGQFWFHRSSENRWTASAPGPGSLKLSCETEQSGLVAKSADKLNPDRQSLGIPVERH